MILVVYMVMIATFCGALYLHLKYSIQNIVKANFNSLNTSQKKLYVMAYLLGGLFAVIVHQFIFLATCTISHDGSFDLHSKPEYTLYGVMFSEYYCSVTTAIIVSIALIAVITRFLSGKLLFIKQWSWQVISTYQLCFIVLFFIPSFLAADVFTLMLDIAFSHFIDIHSINKPDLVFNLKYHFINPDLGLQSYGMFISFIICNGLGFVVVSIKNKQN